MTLTDSDNNGQRKHRRAFVIILVTVLLLLFLYMVSSIVAGVIAGVLLWVMTRWIYNAISKWTGKRQGLAAGLSVFATLLLVIVPLALIVFVMTADAVELAGEIQKWIPTVQDKLNEWMRTIRVNGLSVFGYQFSSEELVSRIGDFSLNAGQFFLGLTQRTASSIVTIVIMLFIALYTLYFFYIDGDRFIRWFKDTLPLEPEHSTRLVDSFFTASIATLKMIGVIGVVQGVAAGIAYVIIGVPAPFLLTMLTIFSTAIPSVGPGLVLVPVAVGLFFAGQIGWAIALLAWGAIVIGNLDNILRPYLMHKTLRMHQLVLFIAMIGGIAQFGFFGVFVGPVIAALLNASLETYKEVFPRPSPEAPRVPEKKSKKSSPDET